ncbi:hypothetical protein FACS189449_04050 [Alphaproteobacteria bacterium]|nr:hypothetical protein FACS189449_04050 [Alphaproteobacteria bacterium]
MFISLKNKILQKKIQNQYMWDYSIPMAILPHAIALNISKKNVDIVFVSIFFINEM